MPEVTCPCCGWTGHESELDDGTCPECGEVVEFEDEEEFDIAASAPPFDRYITQ